MEKILTAINQSAKPGEEVIWNQLLQEFFNITQSANITKEEEQLLIKIIKFEGRLQLSEVGEFPHSMSPEDMLKSMAAQFIIKELESKRLLLTISQLMLKASPSLLCIIKAVVNEKINELQATYKRLGEW